MNIKKIIASLLIGTSLAFSSCSNSDYNCGFNKTQKTEIINSYENVLLNSKDMNLKEKCNLVIEVFDNTKGIILMNEELEKMINSPEFNSQSQRFRDDVTYINNFYKNYIKKKNEVIEIIKYFDKNKKLEKEDDLQKLKNIILKKTFLFEDKKNYEKVQEILNYFDDKKIKSDNKKEEEIKDKKQEIKNQKVEQKKIIQENNNKDEKNLIKKNIEKLNNNELKLEFEKLKLKYGKKIIENSRINLESEEIELIKKISIKKIYIKDYKNTVNLNKLLFQIYHLKIENRFNNTKSVNTSLNINIDPKLRNNNIIDFTKINKNLSCNLMIKSNGDNISPILVHLISLIENNFGSKNISSSGAIGIMQVKPNLIVHYFPEYKDDLNKYLKEVKGKIKLTSSEKNRIFANINTLSYKVGIKYLKNIANKLNIKIGYYDNIKLVDLIKIAVIYHDGEGVLTNSNYLKHPESVGYFNKIFSAKDFIFILPKNIGNNKNGVYDEIFSYKKYFYNSQLEIFQIVEK